MDLKLVKSDLTPREVHPPNGLASVVNRASLVNRWGILVPSLSETISEV